MTGNPKRERSERGFTLMEVMVVIVLAGIVTLGLVTFYLNSQATWMDASTQALAQRDATTLIDYMRERTEVSAQAHIERGGTRLVLYKHGDIIDEQSDSFSWDGTVVHHGSGPEDDVDLGPVVPTVVERFQVSVPDSTPGLVNLELRVRSTTGQVVQMSATMALYNGPGL